MTGSTGASIPLDVATRQMTIANFDLRPASGIEILGIATATCLLTFVLCSMFWTGLRILWDVCYLKSNVSDIPPITNAPKKRDEVGRSVRKWSSIGSGLQTNNDGHKASSYTSHFTRSASHTRVKILKKTHATARQYYHTQIARGGKPASRKPLLLPNTAINTIRRKNNTLDMEEGLGLSSNATASFANGSHSTHPSGTASCRESKSEKNTNDFDKSFLHCRTASL
ncbi:hypothetical protein F5B18DRAFT_333682 [Nemania serpens]|nr:hypothetical protein F5B18DRAFT_333682 [Nemania serpens]